MFDSKSFLANVTHKPGVYRMYDTEHQVIYVGKAKNLKNRLTSYFQKNLTNLKTIALVKAIENIDVTITNTETEALLLEHNYIKQYQPRYNVLFRDDKSYPYIFLSQDKYPYLKAHRGPHKQKGEYFGPYPSMTAVRETLDLLQKIFPIRQGGNKSYSKNKRPYLQYQIGYCLDPTLSDSTSDEDYAQQVNFVRLFLQGKDQQVLDHLIAKMEQASQALQFEQAAKIRDQIQFVRTIIEKQFVNKESKHDIDIIAISYKLGVACIQVVNLRQGKVLGNRSYFPQVPADTNLDELSATFVGQFYLQAHNAQNIPHTIILEQPLIDQEILAELLTQKAHKKINIMSKPRGDFLAYLKLAKTNADEALDAYIKRNLYIKQQYLKLQEFLGLANIQRMECFDISHTMGRQTIASCVVFNQDGPLRKDYRSFNIEGITGGDDYAAMEQALRKRYAKELTPDKVPDIIFIDGGKGQLNRALQVFAELDVNWDKDHPLLIGVAKGVERKPGLETLFIGSSDNAKYLDEADLGLHLIQYIRDEAHNYAIRKHRHKRQKAFKHSELENIKGVGKKRRQLLLQYLGGMQGIRSASVDELASVPGISKDLAKEIFEFLALTK